jgi:general secretion pathway protein L
LAQTWRPSFDRARRAWRGTALPRFFAWWGGELRACLPPRWRAWLQRGSQWLLLDMSPDAFEVRRSGDASALARVDTTLAPELQLAALREASAGIDPADLRLALCLPATAVLRRQLTLPAAARADLRQVLGYEMDRQTPFRVADVHYDVREDAAVADGRVTVELVAAPRARIDPLLQRLAALGVAVDAVDVAEGDGRLGVNLLPPKQRPRHAHPRRRLNRILALAAAVLLLLVMGLWLGNRRAALESMQAQVDALRGEAQQVAALRQRLADSVGAAGFLARRRAQAPSLVDVLDDVTRRLPDGTWLERLTVDEDGRIGLQGQSPQATSLLEQMKGSPLIGEPSFQGVIQTDPRTGKERFYMVAQLHAPATSSSVAGAASTTEAAHARTDAR